MTSITNATTEWLKTPTGVKKIIIAPQKKVLQWKAFFDDGLCSSLKKDKEILGRASTLMNWFQLADRVKSVIKGFRAIKLTDPLLKITEKSVVASSQLASLTKMMALGIHLFHQEGIILLNAVQLAAIRSIGFIATFLGFLKSIIDVKNIIYKFREYHPRDPGLRLEMIQLCGKVCSLIAALFAMGAFVFGGKALILSVTTISLVLSISKYYYKELFVLNSK